MSHGLFVIVDKDIIDGKPIRAVSLFQPEHYWDSGFCLFAGAPEQDIDAALDCIDCLLDEHPELGRALDLARQDREANLTV